MASYLVDLPSGGQTVRYTDPGLLISIPAGKGRWVIDQVRWEAPGEQAAKASRYLATLLQNLGVSFGPPAATSPASK